ncbi:hypothetical protein HDV05_005712 [Chytridiales sp. JEL 0842]|nr:hypothetical protein HDV05_005712 [Chytridiales sp. JEL 0842]
MSAPAATGKVAPDQPDPSRKGTNALFKNERAIAGMSEGDFVALDVVGNVTDEIDYIHDLAPGEEILRRFDVKLKPRPLKDRTTFYLACIFTLGIFWVITRMTKCWREKTIDDMKATLLVTSKGRLGVWKSHTTGTEAGCACCARGNRSVRSATCISWYTIRDISHIQHHNILLRPWYSYFCRCFAYQIKWESNLRIFFSNFPDQAVLDATSYALPKTVQVGAGLKPSKISAYFSVIWYLTAVVSKAVKSAKQAAATVGAISFDEEMTLEISTGDRDMTNPDRVATIANLLEIQEILMKIRGTPDALLSTDSQPSANWMYTPANQRERILSTKDLKIKLDPSLVPLSPGETILDAFPQTPRWTLDEIFFTILSFGLYFIFRVRFRHALKSALLVTQGRVIEVSENWPALYQDPVSFAVRSWFLDGYDTGYMVRERSHMWAELQTMYGSLRLSPKLANKWVWEDKFVGMSTAILQKTRGFLLKLTAVNMQQMYKTPASGAVGKIDSELFDDIPLITNEAKLTVIKSHGVRFTGFESMANPVSTISGAIAFFPCAVCCKSGSKGGETRVVESKVDYTPDGCYKCFTCGRLPYFIKQEILLTTHRVYASAKPTNSPWCFQSCWKTKYDVLFWSSLLSSHFVGSKVTGRVKVQESFCSRNCSCFPCGTCNPAVAESSLSLGFSFGNSPGSKGFGINLFSFEKKAKAGILGWENAREFRMAVAKMQGVKVGMMPKGQKQMTVDAVDYDSNVAAKKSESRAELVSVKSQEVLKDE